MTRGERLREWELQFNTELDLGDRQRPASPYEPGPLPVDLLDEPEREPVAIAAGVPREDVKFLLDAALKVNQAVYGWSKQNDGRSVRDQSRQATVLVALNGQLWRAIKKLQECLARVPDGERRERERSSGTPGRFFVYVLELEDGCFYVGTTKDLERRTAEHWCGAGAEWTKLHRPVRVLARHELGQSHEAYELENFITHKLASEHGGDLVRGGFAAGVKRAPLGAQALEASYALIRAQMRK